MKTFSTAAWMAMVVTMFTLSAFTLSAWGQATQPAAAPAAIGGAGTVTGDNVYVRSGFSTNYYPVTKLHKGDKVTVLRSEFGWLEIEPPAGTHSLVEKTLIDKGEGSTGTANDLTQVYAGSNLDKRRYAKQVKLAKGEKVNIIGETDDGKFYKITPPAGATLWISGDYVQRASGGDAPKIEPVKDLEKAQQEIGADINNNQAALATDEAPAGHASDAGKASAARPTEAPRDPRLTEENRVAITAIEAEITAEMAKPPAERVLEPMLGKLQELVRQSDDSVAKAYAEARMEQVRDQMEIAAAIAEMKQLRETAISQADAIARERAMQRLRRTEYRIDDIVARGTIQVSSVYAGTGGKAKRWRLMDDSTPPRTIAYLELPPGSDIDMIDYYGKYVGIRAISYELLHGTVPPLPVFLVKQIEVIAADAPTKPGVVREEAIAGPDAPVVPNTSTTQPANVAPAIAAPATAAPATAVPATQPTAN